MPKDCGKAANNQRLTHRISGVSLSTVLCPDTIFTLPARVKKVFIHWFYRLFFSWLYPPMYRLVPLEIRSFTHFPQHLLLQAPRKEFKER